MELITMINGLRRISELKGCLPANDRQLIREAAGKLEEVEAKEAEAVSNIASLLKPGQTYGEYLNEQFREMGAPFIPFPEMEKEKQNQSASAPPEADDE